MNIGDKVKVNITNPRSYARGAAECLNGKMGVVESINSRMSICVRFDSPAKNWWAAQSVCLAFHFSENELVPQG